MQLHQFYNCLKEDQEIGEKFLMDLGIPIGSKIICLSVRCGAYLEQKFSQIDYNYHNYRNADIENFSLAAEYLTHQGYYVFRMGAAVEKKMITKNPMIIDYASNGMRSPFWMST